jgi:type II pantothenate kinase
LWPILALSCTDSAEIGLKMKSTTEFNSGEYAMKIMTIDENDLASELSLTSINYPCIRVMLGSAMLTNVMYDDGKEKHCDFNSTSARTFLSIGMALTGAKDFNNLAEMASRGNPSKVDVATGDLRRDGRAGDDWYNTLPGDIELFSLGKLSDEKYKGTYSKDDIAAGLLKSYCKVIAKIATSHARLKGLTSVIFVGSCLANLAVREMLEACFYQETLLEPFLGGDLIRMAIVKNPGYLCALGTWFHNYELEQEEKNKASYRRD